MNEFGDEDDMAAAALTLTQMGAETAIIHHEDGCVARVRTEGGKQGRTFRVRLPRREDVVSTVGSGDALLAGYVSTREPLQLFEELTAQQQVVASAIANHWDPVTASTLAAAGSGSYSTRTRSTASAAMYAVFATTTATASPTCVTRPAANTGWW